MRDDQGGQSNEVVSGAATQGSSLLVVALVVPSDWQDEVIGMIAEDLDIAGGTWAAPPHSLPATVSVALSALQGHSRLH